MMVHSLKNAFPAGLFVLLLTLAYSAVTAPARGGEYEKAVALHDRAVGGAKGAAAGAISLLVSVLKKQPKNAIATAYLGSAYTLRGRDAKEPLDKVRFVNRGVRFLGKALALDLNHFTVRVIRVNVLSNLPAMFRQQDQARADMEALHALYSAHPSPDHARAMVGIYQKLALLEPGNGEWDRLAGDARALAAARGD